MTENSKILPSPEDSQGNALAYLEIQRLVVMENHYHEQRRSLCSSHQDYYKSFQFYETKCDKMFLHKQINVSLHEQILGLRKVDWHYCQLSE